jgi:hypothetical protein
MTVVLETTGAGLTVLVVVVVTLDGALTAPNSIRSASIR